MAYNCKTCRDGEIYPRYGVGPHRHDVNKTGSMIGSTVVEPKEKWPDNFHEDPEAPGCGVWVCPDCDGYGQQPWMQWDGIEGSEPLNTIGDNEQHDDPLSPDEERRQQESDDASTFTE